MDREEFLELVEKFCEEFLKAETQGYKYENSLLENVILNNATVWNKFEVMDSLKSRMEQFVLYDNFENYKFPFHPYVDSFLQGLPEQTLTKE